MSKQKEAAYRLFVRFGACGRGRTAWEGGNQVSPSLLLPRSLPSPISSLGMNLNFHQTTAKRRSNDVGLTKRADSIPPSAIARSFVTPSLLRHCHSRRRRGGQDARNAIWWLLACLLPHNGVELKKVQEKENKPARTGSPHLTPRLWGISPENVAIQEKSDIMTLLGNSKTDAISKFS